MPRGLKVPSSHGVKISSPWPDTWPQTINIKARDPGQQEQRADSRGFVSFTPLSLTPTLLSRRLLLCLHLCWHLSFSPSSTSSSSSLFCLSFSYLPAEAPLMIEMGSNRPTQAPYSPLRRTNFKTNGGPQKALFLLCFIHETDIHRHAKFRPKQGLLLHLLYLCFLWGRSCDPMPIAKPNSHPHINKQRSTHTYARLNKSLTGNSELSCETWKSYAAKNRICTQAWGVAEKHVTG